jgi:CRP/FNR family cyclic AMP-dependent transcriptional regulator
MTNAAKDAAPGPLDEVVRKLAAHGVARSYPKNSIIITEGDIGDSLYIVLSGRVKVYLSDSSGRELVLAVLGPGEYIGEMALDNPVRSASVVTVEPSTLAVLTQARFLDFIEANPLSTLHLIRTLIARARSATDSIRSLAFMDVYGRVARLLIELAREEDGELVVGEPLTQQEIAVRVGCSREMVSRIFKDLIAQGYIHVERRRIHIRRAPPLRT